MPQHVCNGATLMCTFGLAPGQPLRAQRALDRLGGRQLALQVLLSIPLSLAGGLVYTWLKLDNISIATLVGFISLVGITSRNGIMMISHYLHLMKEEGEDFTEEMIIRGSLERLVPVMMTALTAGLSLLPLAIAADAPGKEILHPLAVVVLGGILTSRRGMNGR